MMTAMTTTTNTPDESLHTLPRYAELMKLSKAKLVGIAEATPRIGFEGTESATVLAMIGKSARKHELVFHIVRMEINGY